MSSPTKMIYTLIPKLMKAVGHVGKTRLNEQQKYLYRGIDDILRAVQQPMAELGLFTVPRVLEQRREERTTKHGTAMVFTVLKVRYRFHATDGSYVDVVTVGESMDASDKGSNKALTSAFKYAFVQLLSLPTEGNDDVEAESHEVAPKANGHARPLPTPRATPERIGRLNLLIQQAEVTDELIAQMLVKSHATSLRDMPGRLVERCIERLERKLASRELEHDDADAQVRA